MASKRARKFLKKLANSEEFKIATDYSINSTRMEDQELVLRFIGFYYSRFINNETLKYSGYMSDFLDNAIDILNDAKGETYKRIRNAFYRSMKNAAYFFGKYAFRKLKHEHLLPNARKQFINKSLFTTWSVLLNSYEPDDIKNKVNSNHLTEPLASEIENNNKYYDAITTGTNDLSKIKISFNVTKKILGDKL